MTKIDSSCGCEAVSSFERMTAVETQGEPNQARGYPARVLWEIHLPTLLYSSIGLCVLLAVAGYRYHQQSLEIPDLLLSLADEAELNEDWPLAIERVNRCLEGGVTFFLYFRFVDVATF
ncbi:MAG: hypothetical protein P8L85_12165 [Rubripirellula sp.]|nr:hypothetical protein [Rubripirellula sp.]